LRLDFLASTDIFDASINYFIFLQTVKKYHHLPILFYQILLKMTAAVVHGHLCVEPHSNEPRSTNMVVHNHTTVTYMPNLTIHANQYINIDWSRYLKNTKLKTTMKWTKNDWIKHGACVITQEIKPNCVI